jgi:hypothetical protein
MYINKKNRSQTWWCMPVLPAHRRLRQEEWEFRGNLGYTERSCLSLSLSLSLYIYIYIMYSPELLNDGATF